MTTYHSEGLFYNYTNKCITPPIYHIGFDTLRWSVSSVNYGSSEIRVSKYYAK